MALTATTNSLTKDTLDFKGTVGGSGASKFVYYVQYTKGAETAVKLSISFIKNSISTTTQFVSSPVDTATAAQQVFTTPSATGNWVIPVTIPKCVDVVVAALAHTAGSPDGSVVVDGYPNIAWA